MLKKTELSEPLCSSECDDSDETDYGDIQDREYEVSVYHKRKCETTDGNNQKKKKIEILSQKLACALDRTGTSDRNAMMILTPAIQSMGCKAGEVSLSRQTIRRRRLQSREKLAKEIKCSVSEPLVEQNMVTTIHWDGKMLEDITGKSMVERLPILVSGYQTEKLLCVPKLEKGTGKCIAEAVSNAIKTGSSLKILNVCVLTPPVPTQVVFLELALSYRIFLVKGY